MLKPINILQAAEADLRRMDHNAKEAEFQDPHYHHYAFHRRHVHAAKSARELMTLALMEPHVVKPTTNKGNMRLIYGNSQLLIDAIKLVTAVLALVIFIGTAHARDDGRYANSPLKPWFDGLASKRGPCCSDADGTALSDVDWESVNGRYRVRIEGQWYDVPDDAVLKQPNLYGRTMVWPMIARGIDNKIASVQIRCFIPGSMI